MNPTIKRYLDEYSSFDIGYQTKTALVIGLLISKYEKEILLFNEKYPDTHLRMDLYTIELFQAGREELTHFLQCFGGTWKKELEDYHPDKIQYRQEVPHPFFGDTKLTIAARQVPPPPSCQIVEVEEEVPAYKRKVKKIVCPEGDNSEPYQPISPDITEEVPEVERAS